MYSSSERIMTRASDLAYCKIYALPFISARLLFRPFIHTNLFFTVPVVCHLRCRHRTFMVSSQYLLL